MNACLWRKKENEDNIIEPESKKKKLHEKRGRRYIYNYLIFSGLILQDKTAVNIPFSRKKKLFMK